MKSAPIPREAKAVSDTQDFDMAIRTENVFYNPILDINAADPTVWDGQDGYYYLYHTGSVYSILYRSRDLAHWEAMGSTMPFDQQTIDIIRKMFVEYGSDECLYAPMVVKNDTKYLMYVSLTHKCMIVLESQYPTGPFHFHNNEPYALLSESITNIPGITYEDACVAQEVDGTWYLMWGSHGKLYRTTLSSDGLHLADDAKFDRVAGCDLWPDSVYEGMYVYYRKGYWYLFAARGHYNSEKNPYRIVVGRSKRLDGVFRSRCGLRMTWGAATQIMAASNMDRYLGPGHTGEIFFDDDGNTYMFYQRQQTNLEHFRPLFLQRIYWDEKGWPYFVGDKPSFMEVNPVKHY